MNVLGIETSCDETAAAIVSDAINPRERVKSNIIFSQIAEHCEYGGVVPELAARAHLSHIKYIVERAVDEAGQSFSSLDGIAVTAGPGLIGGVLIGVMVAKALAMTYRKPLLAINHLEGHALTVRLTHDVPYPYLLLLASGGHCQFVLVEGLGRYRVLGETLDDSAGEAFDKVAKMMQLGYPGGPALERYALKGDPQSYILPRPLLGRKDCHLSFSGLKTAMRLCIEAQVLTEDTKANLAASFQRAVSDHLCEKTMNAIKMLPFPCPTLVVAGGVAANIYLCGRLKEVAITRGMAFVAPPIKLCTDNAAMIAWAGMERLKQGLISPLDINPRPRWPLEELAGN